MGWNSIRLNKEDTIITNNFENPQYDEAFKKSVEDKEGFWEEQAKELIKIMKKVPSKLNLIEFNPLSNKDFKPASRENIEKFSKTIQDNGFLSLFRRSRGRDINASCGSLANKKSVINE